MFPSSLPDLCYRASGGWLPAGKWGGAALPSGLGGGLVVDPVKCMLDEFGGVFQAELGLDVFPVRLNGADREVELAGDLAGAAAFADQAKDLELAIRKLLDGGGAGLAAARGHLLDDFALHLVAEENLSGERATDGHEDLFDRLLLHDVAAAAGPQRALGVERFVVHGEDQRWQIGITGLEVLDQLDAIAAFEGDVDDGD